VKPEWNWMIEKETTTMNILLQATEDAKYLNRLNKQSFKKLLFPKSEDSYVDGKWALFQAGMMPFLWSCSKDKLRLIAKYITECKYMTGEWE